MHFFKKQEYENENFKSVELPQITVTDKEFYKCTFTNCNFDNAKIENCKFEKCIFNDCNFSLVSFKDTNFSEVQFKKCKLVGINWAIAEYKSFIHEAPYSFNECVLNYGSFLELKLRELKVINCTATNMQFTRVDLEKADFTGTDLERTAFSHCSMVEANFITAKNYAFNPVTNNVKRAKFSMPQAITLLHGLDIELD